MGLYSKNTIKGIAVEESVESTAVNEQEEFDTMLEEAEIIDCDLLEAAIQIQENDHKMFNALIECDFIEAANNSYMTEADATEANEAGNEKKTGNIKEKIGQLIDAACTAIASAVKKFIEKVKLLFSKDARIIKAYEKNLTVENLKGFNGIANFAMPKTNLSEDSLAEKEAGDFTNAFNDAIKKSEDKEFIDSKWEEFQKKVSTREELINNLLSDETYFEQTVDNFVPNSTQIDRIKRSVASYSGIISDIKKKASKIIGTLKSNKKIAKGNTMKGDSIAAYKMNKVYQATSQTCTLFTKEMKAYIGVAVKQLAAYRKAFIICGKYCNKAAKGGKVEDKTDEKIEKVQGEVVENESVLNWAIGESSDAYVTEYFAY